MYKNLNTGAIGIKASLSESLEFAGAYGFEGVDFSINEALDLVKGASVEEVRELFSSNKCRPGGWGLPVNWYGEASKWEDDLGNLRQQAAVARDIGALRTTTVILPFSDDLTFSENYRFHVDRLKPCAEILAESGCSLGLEFIGPKTLRTRKYDFLYTMDVALEIGMEMGNNVGLLLDLWHLYTSHGAIDDVRSLNSDQVVSVHVNDAPTGVDVDEQIDNVRCLPGETGVLDIGEFLKALKAIGYDGPVTSEPFSKRINELDPQGALAATSASMQTAWSAAGLPA